MQGPQPIHRYRRKRPKPLRADLSQEDSIAHPIYKNAEGKRLPSVTTVISKHKDPGGLIHWAWTEGVEGRDYRKTRDAAGDIGHTVHDLVEQFISTGEDPDLFEEPEAVGMAFGSFQRWLECMKIEIKHTEVSLVCECHQTGGTPDAIGVLPSGAYVLLDWKTSGSIYPDHLVQVAAYKHLALHGTINGQGSKALASDCQEIHIVRFGKEFGEFRHQSCPLTVADLAWEQFCDLRSMYDRAKRLKKACG